MRRTSTLLSAAAAVLASMLLTACAVPPPSSGEAASDVSAGTELTGSRIKYKGGAQPLSTANKEDAKDALRASGGGNPNK